MDKLNCADLYIDFKSRIGINIVQFGSYTCAPCSAIKQRIDSWIEDHPAIMSLYVPIEEFPQIAASEGIFSVPTILVYINGQMTIRESGYFSLDNIFDKIERYIEIIEL